jgi:hypothetical protein
MASATIDFIQLPVYNTNTIVFGDTSHYDSGFSVLTPTRQITPPGFAMKSIAYTPLTVEVYDSASLGITCSESGCAKSSLPDGIWTIKQMVAPTNIYVLEKTFLKVDKFYEKFDAAYLKLDIMQCDGVLKTTQEKELNNIEFYIQGAIAASNACATKRALELYIKANSLLDKFVKNQNCS